MAAKCITLVWERTHISASRSVKGARIDAAERETLEQIPYRDQCHTSPI